MSEDNFTRMRKLAEEFFVMHNDPSQLSVDGEVIERLTKIHPGTLNEERNEDGPVAWILIVPTTENVMKKFIRCEIGERELLDQTPVGEKYDAIYLCSALVLPEFRGKGIAKKIVRRAIENIQKEHPIKYLFVWSFSEEGERLANSTAEYFNLPLEKKNNLIIN